MSNLIPHLSKLAERINAEHRQAHAALCVGLEHAKNAGALLLEAKEQCEHGQWLPWLEANVCFSIRTAQAYMRVAERWPELEAKAQGLAHLTFEQALDYLAEPRDADRLEAIQKARIPEQYHEEALEHMKQAEPREAKQWWYERSGRQARDYERARKEAAYQNFQRRIKRGDFASYLLEIGDETRKLTRDFEPLIPEHPARYYENVGHCQKLIADLEALQAMVAILKEDLTEAVNKATGPKVIPPDSTPLLPHAEIIDPE
jgi:hypothetical protein